MINKGDGIINIILWIWSHLPIFSLSDDDNFATLEWKKIRLRQAHLRISLLNLMFGDRILYVITYDIKQRKLKLAQLLCLEKMEGILLTDENIEGIQNRFRNHIQSLNGEELEIEKEALSYHIQNEEQRISTSMDKLNIYATIILTVLPLFLAILDLKKVFSLPLSLLVGVILLIYALLNICAYVFRVIKIRGIEKSSFRDLRESQNKEKEILVQYQYDWQQLKYKAQLFVSFVLNLQEWVVAILVLAIFISIGVSFESVSSDTKVGNYDLVNTLRLEEIDEPYSESAIIWAELISDIEQKKCGQVFLILRESTDVSFLNKLNKYKSLSIKIVEDKTLEKGELKIIQEE